MYPNPYLDPNPNPSLNANPNPNPRPIMHGAGLMWLNGKYFNTPVRLLPFLKMVCNDIVRQCQKSCELPSMILHP